MYQYTVTQWVLFFFCYCFLGWIWECFFVSVTQAYATKKWKLINRGFLHGPVIPIYGFAAISILLVTIPIRDHTLSVYFMGALTATIFELVTGTAMEKFFKVKYWDYSNLPLNYHGHICLFVSLFWGVFAVLLVQVVHVPIESLLLKVAETPAEAAAFSLLGVFAYDTAVSFNEAMDLRDLLESLTESNETIQRLERRFDAVVAFTPVPDMDDFKEITRNTKELVLYNLEKRRRQSTERLTKLRDQLQLPEWENSFDREELLEQIGNQIHKVFSRHDKQYLRAVSQLRRNPRMRSERHKETLETLKKLLKNKDS